MSHLGLILAVALAQSGRIAVLGVVSDDRAYAPQVSPLSNALLSEGWTVIAGPALRERLVGEGKPFAQEISRTIEQQLIAARESYDRGDFGVSARLAALAFEAAARAIPSPAREALIPELQIVWGAALSQLKGSAAASPHFREALQRNPRIAIDKDRFAPPVRLQFEQERSRIASGPQVRLQISGTPGATLFIDGIPRGDLPLTVTLAPHRCTLWIEMSSQPGLAHELLLPRSTSLSIDWRLEVASRFADGEWAVQLPVAEVDRRALLQRILQRAGADELIALEWTTAGTISGQVRRLAVVRYGPDGIEKGRELAPTDSIDWRRLVRVLRERGSPLSPMAVAQGAAPQMHSQELSHVAPEAQTRLGAHASEGSRFPWLTVGLVAGGVALVGGAVALGLSLHSTNAVFLGPETPRP